MISGVVGTGALALVESEFAFLIDEYAFALAQTSDVPVGLWYRSPRGAVVVRYDPLGDAALDVGLEEPGGAAYSIGDVLSPSVRDAERRLDVRELPAFSAEIDRLKRLLVVHCDDFLRGDLPAFRSRFREALLVRSCRNLANEEILRGDVRRGIKLLESYRSYWTEADKELHACALEGTGSLTYLRAAG
ncbi:MAG: hypothetical protein GIW95_04230 [Candidatus Eremiobacteraeota bacterium]|nr:hypothetical protein [Candidatus Eremiobacteraeota bacterium]